MKLLELLDLCDGKFKNVEETKQSKSKKRLCTLDEFNTFKEWLAFNEIYLYGLKDTEESDEFYAAYEFLRELTPDEIKEDVFYATKVGYILEGVPSKLVFILKKALSKYKTPNVALSAIDRRLLSKYLTKDSLPAGITIRLIMEDILGCTITLLSEYKKSIRYRDVFEVYVENTDRVLVIPESMGDYVQTQQDLENVSYVKDLGVCLYDKPMRTLGGKLGVVTDEYDLRGGL